MDALQVNIDVLEPKFGCNDCKYVNKCIKNIVLKIDLTSKVFVEEYLSL